MRSLYSLGYLRAIIHVTLVASFLLGSVSAFLRANKVLALTGIGFTLAAALLGGSQVPVEGEVGSGSWLGLDFFVLNLLLYSLSSFRSSASSHFGPTSPSSAASR